MVGVGPLRRRMGAGVMGGGHGWWVWMPRVVDVGVGSMVEGDEW